jgi:DNA-3-methyladenine glycosylase
LGSPELANRAAVSSAPSHLGVSPLSRDDLPAETAALARFLIGKTLVREIEGCVLSGRIVETEAYVPGDAASHAFRGPTARNRSMFLAPGHAYVYIAYGVWPALNVSSEPAGFGGGVLLRALEPLTGIEEMRRNRGTERLLELARGPGRLAAALRVTLAEDGIDLCAEGPLWLGGAAGRPAPIGATTRIGISKETERPLRFYERGSPFVSGPRRLLSD